MITKILIIQYSIIYNNYNIIKDKIKYLHTVKLQLSALNWSGIEIYI